MDPITGDIKNNPLNDNSEGGGNGTTTMALQKKAFQEGFDGQLEEPRDSEGGNDDDNDEEMVMRSSFLHPMESPSPGSTIGSATSNDEDNFFGPVSASFIRPGQLSDFAASDDNHDVTMDSTAFSMHFHSLARSESGVELNTPTGVHLSFEEKTETNENVGSFMKLTLVKKPISESSIVATNASGSHDSNDMSLVGENPSKKKLLAVGASDDTNASQSPGRMKSRLSVSYDGNSVVDLSEFAKQEIGTIISHDLQSKEVSDVHGKISRGKWLYWNLSICHPPQGFSFNPSNAAAFDISKDNQNRSLNQLSKDNFVEESVKDTHKMWRPNASLVITGNGLSEPNNKCSHFNQHSHNESGSPMVGSISLTAKRRQTSLSNSSPSKYLRLGTPFQERHSFLSSENIKRLESDLSIQKSISKLELFEKSSFSSSFSTEIDKSYVKSLDFSKSSPFDTFKGKEHEDFKIKHVKDSVSGEKLSSSKEQNRTFSVVGNRFENPNHNFRENYLEESLAHTKSEKYANDIHATILHADHNADSPSQFTGTESSLAQTTSDEEAKEIVSPHGYVTSLGKRLENKFLTSPANQGGQSKDLEQQNQFAQLPDFDPV
ncbi:unnamed protein product [Fraxinus pennsylvanica]|uniref:Uncharacterized protein n=1 Tax=Fraxinus pennsylvanica TaxID=56036 RepID=A0AAD1Z279_9LAMI|nr:unnamed protein product [Fraxinus pennsylvanica]